MSNISGSRFPIIGESEQQHDTEPSHEHVHVVTDLQRHSLFGENVFHFAISILSPSSPIPIRLLSPHSLSHRLGYTNEFPICITCCMLRYADDSRAKREKIKGKEEEEAVGANH